jgi:hypothetical protein
VKQVIIIFSDSNGYAFAINDANLQAIRVAHYLNPTSISVCHLHVSFSPYLVEV